jgi:hypothetical protein
MPRRSIDDTEEKDRTWWIDQAEGLDLIYAATSFEAKRWTRTADQETRQALYDHHLRHYTESKVVDILNSTPVLDALAILGDESKHQFFKLQQQLHRTLFCEHCGASEITGPQGSHTCDGIKGSMWIDPTPYLEATAQARSFPGLLTTPITVPKILVKGDSSPEFIVTVGIFRYFESLSTPMIELLYREMSRRYESIAC